VTTGRPVGFAATVTFADHGDISCMAGEHRVVVWVGFLVLDRTGEQNETDNRTHDNYG
jgi:hypothetical protein